MENNEKAKAKIQRLAQKLLDVGKRNNLVNCRMTKSSTLEVLYPSSDELLHRKAETVFEVYDPALSEKSEECISAYGNREAFLEYHLPLLKKSKQILLFNPNSKPYAALKNIGRRAAESIEETGVGIAYIAAGFVYWTDTDGTQNKSPLFLLPVQIERESALHPYTIRIIDDEAIINPTFQYILDAKYGLKLPEYADEELAEYFDKLSDISMRMNWRITKECILALFSFQKLNMYQDLMQNANSIAQNPLVCGILGEGSFYGDMGETYEKPELHSVIDADSSQEEAITLAKAGKSFVLQGPPGTGKSQTITNIIAEALYDGKHVLFVSEKLAALKVVYDKLAKVGLADFCLELHSHKANKKNVIDELARTLRADKSTVTDRVDSELSAKNELESKLNLYEHALHEKRPVIEKTLYELYEKQARYRDCPDVEWYFGSITDKNEKWLTESASVVEQAESFMPTVGYNYRVNCWYGYVNHDITEQTRKRAEAVVLSAKDFFAALNSSAHSVSFACLSECDTPEKLLLWREFLKIAKDALFIKPVFFDKSAAEAAMSLLPDLGALSEDINALHDRIRSEFDKDVFSLDCENMYRLLTRSYTSFFSRAFNAEYRNIIRSLRYYRKNGKKVSYKEAVSFTKDLYSYKEKTAEFDKKCDELRRICDGDYSTQTNWTHFCEELAAVCPLLDKGLDLSGLAGISNDDYAPMRTGFSELYAGLSFLDDYDRIISGLSEFFDMALLDIANTDTDITVEKFANCADSAGRLVNWCSFLNVLDRAKDMGIISFIDCAIMNNVEPGKITGAYIKRFYTMWIDSILSSDSALAGFTRVSHDKNVNDFVTKDKSSFAANKAKLRSALSSLRPSCDMIAPGSPVSVLLRESEKKRKLKPVRMLITEIGDLIQVLKPCFLMSPLSVSSYLDPAAIHFDLVIFDEASQVFTQDALGSIYRADKVIVVGDSRQMPPSNFFNAALDETDDEAEDVADFESILDICSSSMRQLRLRWHYRSRCEQLIAFSNRNFYLGNLITFPSSKKPAHGFGVEYYHVDGVFDRQSKTNRAEAEFIVDRIFEHIAEYPDRSLGVVAFSISQQDLIERLLLTRRQSSPETEFFFASNRKEPFFVKNLETVQGDERDTIIFSIAYAPDADGKLIYNFGPLNKLGGERRLNVAVTRAKLNTQVVASIHYTDLDLNRTSSEGVRLLHDYLDYAENGEAALTRMTASVSGEEMETELENEVCEFLSDNGFTVETQVGCSGYRIDIAVRKSETDDYVLAIECDGDSYHSAGSARDRDRLRAEILQNMGWSFYRIWSTEWFRNKVVEKQRLIKAVRAALSSSDSDSAHTDDGADDTDMFEEIITEEASRFPKYEAADLVGLSLRNRNYQDFVREVLDIEAPLSEELFLKRTIWMYGREKITSVVLRQFDEQMKDCEKKGIIRRGGFMYTDDGKPIRFRVPGSFKREIHEIAPEEIADCILQVLSQNISVKKEALFHIVAELCGITRAGRSVTEYLESCLLMMADQIVVEGEVVSLRH